MSVTEMRIESRINADIEYLGGAKCSVMYTDGTLHLIMQPHGVVRTLRGKHATMIATMEPMAAAMALSHMALAYQAGYAEGRSQGRMLADEIEAVIPT